MAFVEPDECISIFSLYISFFYFFLGFHVQNSCHLDFFSNYPMFVTLMPYLYVLLCGPKIHNKDSCILYTDIRNS